MFFPYIGITDFLSFEQVARMLTVFNAHNPQGSMRRLHVGVMMSYKTLHGIETKWSKAFPPKEAIASIFGSEETYNCLHYADYDHMPNLGETLYRAIGYGGIGINAIQLDMPWPDPRQIVHGVHMSRRNIEVILQVGKVAIEEADNDPQMVVQRLEDYEGVIHRVLLDKSMGRGVGMDAVALLPFAHAVRARFPNLGLVAAGGLGPQSINLVEPLIAEFPDLSIDAQGKLRSSGNALDPIDWNIAAEYLVKALALFGK